MKKYIVAVTLLPLLFFMSACGESSGNNADTATTSAQETKPVDFNGKWSMVEKIDGVNFLAEISDNHIVINWSVPEDNFTALYWDGTFPKSDSNRITSQGNVEKMKASLLASNDKEKLFVYKDDKLAYEFTIQGTTRTLHLTKD